MFASFASPQSSCLPLSHGSSVPAFEAFAKVEILSGETSTEVPEIYQSALHVRTMLPRIHFRHSIDSEVTSRSVFRWSLTLGKSRSEMRHRPFSHASKISILLSRMTYHLHVVPHPVISTRRSSYHLSKPSNVPNTRNADLAPTLSLVTNAALNPNVGRPYSNHRVSLRYLFLCILPHELGIFS
jgi:hypothetical protein